MSETLDTPLVDTATPAHETSWEREIAGIRVVFGAGRLSEVGTLAAALGGRKILLVTDPGLVASGHVAAALSALDEAGVGVEVFDGVSPNPTTAEVNAGTVAARRESIDLIAALGGGSAMDCAKGINFLLTNGGRMEDYWGFGKATRPMLPSIGIPTTAGTGSEAQSYALISQVATHRKMGCGDPKARFRTVLLDPGLLTTVPRRVAAAAGIDALSHALESQVTPARTKASSPRSRRAFELLERSVEAVARPDTSSLEDRGRALLGAHLAGAGIEASMLGAAHAAANPLTARFGVPHGEAIGLMLPPVIRFNSPVAESLYAELWPTGGQSLAARVEAIREAMGLPLTLREFGIAAGDLPPLAADASEERTARFNPRPVDRPAFEELYASAL
jgi:alcohol dehydrogenase